MGGFLATASLKPLFKYGITQATSEMLCVFLKECRIGPHFEISNFKGRRWTELPALYLWGCQRWKIKGSFSKAVSRGWVNPFWRIPMNFHGMSIASVESFWNLTWPSSDNFWKMCVLSTHSWENVSRVHMCWMLRCFLRSRCFERKLRKRASEAILVSYSVCPSQ